MNKDTKKKKDFHEQKRDMPKEKTYISKEIETSITLLESPEISVVTEALLFLSKYADIQEENLTYLQQQEIIPKLVKLLQKPLPIIRLSLRLISILLNKTETVYELDNEKYNEFFLVVHDMLINNPDAPIKEFSATILAKMSTSTRVVLLIFESDTFTPVFQFLGESTNSSLINNILQLFYGILDAPTAIAQLAAHNMFNPIILLNKINNSDAATINLVLDIFKKITSASLDPIQQKLKEALFVERMLQIVLSESAELLSVFEIIINCIQNPITSSYYVESLEFLEFCVWTQTCSAQYLLPIAVIFEKITSIPSIKQTLFDFSAEDAILYLLRSKDKKVLSLACSSISNMSIHRYCCEKMATPMVLREILVLMQFTDNITNYNEVAVETLHNFCKRYNRTLELINAYKGHEVIIKYFNSGLTLIPEETYLKILEIIILLISTDFGKSAILTEEFFANILKQLEFENEQINVACFEVMSYCVSDKNFRESFTIMNGPVMLINLMKTCSSKKLFKSILIFIHSNLVYKSMAEIFLNVNLVQTLKNFPSEMQDDTPLIGTCLNLMYSLFLPLKFFEKCRLDVGDRFESNFYMVTGFWKGPFPCLSVIESQYLCTLQTVYLVDYTDALSYRDDMKAPKSRKNSKKSLRTIDCSRARDPYLLDFIITIKSKIVNQPIEKQIGLVAAFVDAQLCGPEDVDSQKVHSFNLHIESLKKKLGSNVIPVGYLRVGFHCERSLLFKAICDKICIPCALAKGNDNIYWNEVPLIVAGRNSGNLRYYVVDLMEHIGELYSVGSRDANAYCNINPILDKL